MTHRATNREAPIVNSVIEQKADGWSEETRKVARTDAQRVLEALVAEYGVVSTMQALDNQGLKGSAYGYLLNPLYTEAQRRRTAYQAASSGCQSGKGNPSLQGTLRQHKRHKGVTMSATRSA